MKIKIQNGVIIDGTRRSPEEGETERKSSF